MNRFLKLLVITSLAWAIPGNAYFVMGRMWEKTNDHGEQQYLVALGDRHEQNEQTQKQFYELMERVPQNALILNEDSYHQRCTSIQQSKLRNYFFGHEWIHNSANVLTNITYAADRHTIKNINIEWREVLWADPHAMVKFFDNSSLTCAQIAPTIEKIIKDSRALSEICKRFGDEELQKICAEFIARGESNIACLERLNQVLKQEVLQNQIANVTILESNADFLLNGGSFIDEQGKPTPEAFCLTAPFLAATPFLEINILHQLHLNRNCPAIFICAGALHIAAIEQAITHLGYTPVVDKNRGDLNCEEPFSIATFLEPLFPKVRSIKRPTFLARWKKTILAGSVLAGWCGLVGYGFYKLRRWALQQLQTA